ncbi:MAG: argininosuccinate lyase [Anaerolineae bacterium]|nr:argininosuccinate lyase [Anaerolineae bacterium]
MKLWTGRLDGNLDQWAELLNHSLPIDQRMAQQDVRGSIAWAQAIHTAGLIDDGDLEKILTGLESIAAEFTAETFIFSPGDEDIHTAVERRLVELCGKAGEKLHTGRSRNDQVATDFRMWTLEALQYLDGSLESLQETILARAEFDFGIIIPGYTHLQQAQPVLLSHWWLSHFWALSRDRQRFHQSAARTSVLPLGSAALAGTSFPIDRAALAQQLGFQEITPNSIDAVGDRDFAAEFLFIASLCATHLSRMAELLILFSTQEFSLITLADAFSTGSSIMPQKKNPDPLELVRGKSGIILGKLMSMMTVLKAMPSAYDKDLQEDKELVFTSFDLLDLMLKVMAGVIRSLEINQDRAEEILHPYMVSTDLADELVKRGLPFRQAHHAVAAVVKKAEETGTPFQHLPLQEWQNISPLFGSWVYEMLSASQSVQRHIAWGGTAPTAVQQQLVYARDCLSHSN